MNWTKPIAIAELGARSNRTSKFQGGCLYPPPADLTSQAFWLNHVLEIVRDRDFEFYVRSFSDDYEPIGAWTLTMGGLYADRFSLINNFAYMGIYNVQGTSKAGVTEIWMHFLDN